MPKTFPNTEIQIIVYTAFIALCKVYRYQAPINSEMLQPTLRKIQHCPQLYQYLTGHVDELLSIIISCDLHHNNNHQINSNVTDEWLTYLIAPSLESDITRSLQATGQHQHLNLNAIQRVDITLNKSFNQLSTLNIIYLFFSLEEICWLEKVVQASSPYKTLSPAPGFREERYSVLTDAIFNRDTRVFDYLIQQKNFDLAYRDATGISVFESMIFGFYLGPINFTQIALNSNGQQRALGLFQRFGQLYINITRYQKILEMAASINESFRLYQCNLNIRFAPLYISHTVFWQPGVKLTTPITLSYAALYLFNSQINTPQQSNFKTVLEFTTLAILEDMRYSKQPTPPLNSTSTLVEHAIQSKANLSVFLLDALQTYNFDTDLTHIEYSHQKDDQLGSNETPHKNNKLLHALTVDGYSSQWHYKVIIKKCDTLCVKRDIHFFHETRIDQERNFYLPAVMLSIESTKNEYNFSLKIRKKHLPNNYDSYWENTIIAINELPKIIFEIQKNKLGNIFYISKKEYSQQDAHKPKIDVTEPLSLTPINLHGASPANSILEVLTILGIPNYMARTLFTYYLKPISNQDNILARQTPVRQKVDKAIVIPKSQSVPNASMATSIATTPEQPRYRRQSEKIQPIPFEPLDSD